MRLVRVVESPVTGKKYRAEFEGGKHTDFGASGMSDYTINQDKDRRERYRSRHRKDLETNDPTRAGYLSWYLLWGDSTSLRTNIAEYKRRFNM